MKCGRSVLTFKRNLLLPSQ